ncbi:MAG: GGDEF domain-containing protein [Gammaproteobacteria bacterium]|nr:GGDEF domain-containing protein [Gammaproteobacteria bacterium]
MNIDYDIHIGDALSAAVGLTSQKSGQAVSEFMHNWLTSWDFIANASIFEVFETNQEKKVNSEDILFRRVSTEHGEQRLNNREPGLQECINSRRQVEIDLGEGCMRLLFKVKSKFGPLRVVAVDGKSINPQERFLCLHLIQLYENQINIYDEKERDALSGLLNRQTFDETLIKIASQVLEPGKAAFVAILDIDHFKRVNDTYGHLYGDEVLLKFSQLMKVNFRYSDYLFRFGGEEFIVLINDSTLEGAQEALERYRHMVENYDFPVVGKVTVSIGYVLVESSIMPTSLVDYADKALYHAKENGRNRITFYEDIKSDINQQIVEDDIELF